MFKSWQIFVFSLIPLALVFAGVIIGSMDGIDAEREVFPTRAPQAEGEERPPADGEEPTPSAPSEPSDTTIQLIGFNLEFDQRALTASAGGTVTIEFDNQDPSVLHNFALYVDNSLAQQIFSGELVTGPAMTTYTFEAPAPGTYFFRCDVHPDTMTGSFTVQ